METREDYWDDPVAKAAFIRFLKHIHGLDLGLWDRLGYWDEAYTPFSFFEKGEVVASVCLYLIRARLQGRDGHVAQISGVGTRSEYRRQGLSRELTRRALEWAAGRHEALFLFADEEAKPVYRRLGFEEWQDYFWSTEAEPVPPMPGARRLDMDSVEDRRWITALAERRCAPSEEFSCLQPKLLLFHLLYDRGLEILRLPGRDCAVLLRRGEEKLQVLDFLAEEVQPFEAWFPFVTRGERRVDFRLPVDRLKPPSPVLQPARGNDAFVSPGFPLERPVFPATIFA